MSLMFVCFFDHDEYDYDPVTSKTMVEVRVSAFIGEVIVISLDCSHLFSIAGNAPTFRS